MANEENLIDNSVRTPSERRENARKAGIKSGEVRREKAQLRKLGYTGVESFDKLNELQQQAISNGNITAALKAEELKGKLAGLYVEKVAQTDSKGADVPINDLSKIPTATLLKMAERVEEKIDE